MPPRTLPPEWRTRGSIAVSLGRTDFIDNSACMVLFLPEKHTLRKEFQA